MSKSSDNHPVVVIVGLIAGIAAIVAFAIGLLPILNAYEQHSAQATSIAQAASTQVALASTYKAVASTAEALASTAEAVASTAKTQQLTQVAGTQIALQQTPSVLLTYTPFPTYTPTANPVEIAVLNINSEVQADGTVKNTADLSIAPLGLGTLQLASPATMKLGESGVIRLTITPDSALVDLPKVTVPTVSASDPGYVLEFSDRLQIYPVMIAELKGVNFEIASDGRPEKPVTSSLPVEWIWNVTPKSGGKQTLILAVSVPVIVDQTRDVVSAQTLKNIPIEIRVEVTATPIPSQTPQPTQTPIPTLTPTPLPAITRLGEQLIENASAIVVAIIGLIGVLAGAYVAYLNIKKPKAATSTVKGKTKKK